MSILVKIRILLLLPILLLPGCGEAESPRFVPTTAAAKAGSPVDRGPADKSGRDGVVPKNIEMH